MKPFFERLDTLPFGAGGCKKDFAVPENSLSSREGTEGVYQSVEDEIDSTYEFYDEERDTLTDDFDAPPYQSEITVTKITAINPVDSSKAIGDKGIEFNLNCPSYKYYGRYITSRQGKWYTATLSRPDSVKLPTYQEVDSSGIYWDSLVQIDPTHVRVHAFAIQDTMQTKTSGLSLQSQYEYKYTGTDGIVRMVKYFIRYKMKFVGELDGQLYGNNRWMERYWRHYMKTENATFPTGSELIDQTYIVQAGDIFTWFDGHTGTVMPYPTPQSYIVEATKKLPRYRVNRFWISEMNSRCKGEKTIKMIWMKSYKPSNTLRGANKLRGSPSHYHRKVQ